jgi:tRNA A-37 threonylcarbamoyl transferase component Bud32
MKSENVHTRTILDFDLTLEGLMMMQTKTITLSDEFTQLRDFILALPTKFDTVGTVIQDNRNIVKSITTPQGLVVVKKFSGMYFFNRLAYSLFRKSKAARSYLYSKLLNEKGISTPAPIAWLDCYNYGLLNESYFVSLHKPDKTLRQMTEANGTFKNFLYKHLASFALTLHQLGIYHDDFSSGNILIHESEDGYDFSMVDLNRIKFQKVSFEQGLQNLAKLALTDEEFNILVSEYARIQNRSPEKSCKLFWSFKRRSSFLRKIRKRLKKYALTPMETIFTNERVLFLIFIEDLLWF